MILQPLSLTYTHNEKEGERRGIGTREIEGALSARNSSFCFPFLQRNRDSEEEGIEKNSRLKT